MRQLASDSSLVKQLRGGENPDHEQILRCDKARYNFVKSPYRGVLGREEQVSEGRSGQNSLSHLSEYGTH